MPDDALPQPWTTPMPGAVRYRRMYRDALGRPMSGTVTFTGTTGHDTGDVAVPAAPVTVTLVDGAVDVHLPADTYSFAAALRTADGARTADQGTVVLEAP